MLRSRHCEHHSKEPRKKGFKHRYSEKREVRKAETRKRNEEKKQLQAEQREQKRLSRHQRLLEVKTAKEQHKLERTFTFNCQRCGIESTKVCYSEIPKYCSFKCSKRAWRAKSKKKQRQSQSSHTHTSI